MIYADNKNKPSNATINRLPRYYRYARDLLGNDVKRISSSELAKMMDLNSSQIRADVSLLGEFGQQGYGYNTRELYEGLGEALGLKHGWKFIIVGDTALGRSLANMKIFEGRGIKLSKMFDYSPANSDIGFIMDIPDYCKKNGIDVAILCVDSELAMECCRLSLMGGVRGIWNLTGCELRVKRTERNVVVSNLNFADLLLALCGEIEKNEILNDGNTDGSSQSES